MTKQSIMLILDCHAANATSNDGQKKASFRWLFICRRVACATLSFNRTFTLVLQQVTFTNTNGFWGNFYQFIIINKLNCTF